MTSALAKFFKYREHVGVDVISVIVNFEKHKQLHMLQKINWENVPTEEVTPPCFVKSFMAKRL
jgi:hypothetical protein